MSFNQKKTLSFAQGKLWRFSSFIYSNRVPNEDEFNVEIMSVDFSCRQKPSIAAENIFYCCSAIILFLEMSALYTGKSLYGSSHYLFTVLMCLPGLSMASLWQELTSSPLDMGFDHVTDCDLGM